MENKISKFFKNLFARAGKLFLADPKETLYKELGEKVDFILEHKIDDIDLAVKFNYLYQNNLMANGIRENYKEIQKYKVQGMYTLQSKVTKEQALELAGKFLTSVFPDKKEHFLEILKGEGKNNENQKIFLRLDEIGKTEPYTTAPDYPSDDITVNVPLYGDLRDVYSLVHEITHTMDARSGANETRSILGEIAPQAMERALDDFLDKMSKEDREKYGFDLKTLEQDIKDRRLATFVDRTRIIRDLPRQDGPDKMKSSRYMLAQIYQSKFLKLYKSPEQFGQEITKFTKAIEANDFEKANSIVGIDLNPRKISEREGYIFETIKQFLDEIKGKTALKTNDEIIEELEEKYKRILSTKPKEAIEQTFSVIEKRREQVHQGIKPKDEKFSPEVEDILKLMESFKKEAREKLVDNDVTLIHISSIPPERMEGRKLRRSINRANNYETDLVDCVFASSEPADGTNPYIARNDGGMVLLGDNIYVYGGDNIDVSTDNSGKSHAVLKQPNYAYFINPETFEPVVCMSRDRQENPFFEFSHEWISPIEMSLTDARQVYGYKTITDISDLLKNYQVLSDVNKQGLGMKIRNMPRKDKAKFVVEQITAGNLRYINGEAKINAIDMDKVAEESMKS